MDDITAFYHYPKVLPLQRYCGTDSPILSNTQIREVIVAYYHLKICFLSLWISFRVQ